MAPTRAAVRVALDLDGTLVDARTRQVAVAAAALAWAGGGELAETRFWRAKRAGATTRDALARLGCSDPVAERAARRWAELIETDEWLELDRALPGVKRVLAQLRAEGAQITVLTARRRADGARRSIAVAGLAPAIDELVVVDPADAVAAKAVALRRGRALAFIGDTDSDGQAARAAGVPFAAVTTGQRSPGYLAARGYAVGRSLRAALALLDAV